MCYYTLEQFLEFNSPDDQLRIVDDVTYIQYRRLFEYLSDTELTAHLTNDEQMIFVLLILEAENTEESERESNG